jgi:hypothetical protein
MMNSFSLLLMSNSPCMVVERIMEDLMRYASGARRPMNRVDRPPVGDVLCRKVGVTRDYKPLIIT